MNLYLSIKCHYRQILMMDKLAFNLLTNFIDKFTDKLINHQIIHR